MLVCMCVYALLYTKTPSCYGVVLFSLLLFNFFAFLSIFYAPSTDLYPRLSMRDGCPHMYLCFIRTFRELLFQSH